MLMQNGRRELQEHLKGKTRRRTIVLHLFLALCVLITVVWFGRHLGAEMKALEAWIADLGVWGPIVFVGSMIILTSIFVPDTLLAVAAGVLFGLLWGTVFTIVGAVVTATLDYLVARKLFRMRIEKTLSAHPKFRAIQRMAVREGLRLQLLLRLSPVNPVSVSYILGAAGVRYSTFLLATTGLIPMLFVEVYFGHLASHVTKVAGNVGHYSSLHTTVTVGGFAVCIAVIIYIMRAAARALAEEHGDLS